MTRTEVQLSPDQMHAHTRIYDWFAEDEKQTLSLGGYAGTGKTTIISHILNSLETKRGVKVLTPTGKASHVLRSKGVKAQTIHSSIYNTTTYKEKGKTCLDFEWRPVIEGGNPDLFIVDEASMVSTDVYEDLLKYNIPILWVGDHGQLEPVGENPKLMENPEIKLEKIHRQAADNPVLVFAHNLRNGATIKDAADGLHGDGRLRVVPTLEEAHMTSVSGSPPQILCGFNRTRYAINRDIRTQKGNRTDVPVVGDRVICHRNYRKEGLFNGMMGTIVNHVWDGGDNFVTADFQPDDTDTLYRELRMSKREFNGKDQYAGYGTMLFDYAYALTTHKSQGSEWSNVWVIDEQAPKLWSPERWRYTAATRAIHHLTFVGGRS